MPANLAGAYVPIFVGAADHGAGVERGVRKLQSQGYQFLDLVDTEVYELDPEQWDQFVGDAWPEFAAEFPKQEDVLKELEREFLFTGPFISYEPKKAE